MVKMIPLVILCCPALPHAESGYHERRLFGDLMSDYNKLERPVYTPTDYICVKLAIRIRDLMYFNIVKSLSN